MSTMSHDGGGSNSLSGGSRLEPAPLPVKTEGRYERIAGNEPAGSKRIRDESKTNTEDECAVDRLQSLRNANDVNQYSLQMCKHATVYDHQDRTQPSPQIQVSGVSQEGTGSVSSNAESRHANSES